MATRSTRRLPRPLLPAGAAVAFAAAFVLAFAGSAQALPSTFPHTSLGNRGADVRALQYLLRARGSSIPVSGIFDAATESAVKAFQVTHGLQVTGRVGTTTWTPLVVRVATGSTGEAVTAVQRLLNEKRRAGLTLTGRYDAATLDAVRRFQRHAGLSVSGVVGTSTWRALLAHLELPIFGASLCDYSVGNGAANWGTSAAIGQLEQAARRVHAAGYGRVPVGDISLEHGGDIAGHVSHEVGMDVDVRPYRRGDDQCRIGTNWRASSYDRTATRALVKAIRGTAPGHVKLIWFNDPVLIREGLTSWHSGHDDHLHIRYCERWAADARYDC